MKLATFKASNKTRLGGIINDEKLIVDLELIDRRFARREKRRPATFLKSMVELLEAGNRGLNTAKSLIKAADREFSAPDSKICFTLSKIKLGAPVQNPKKVFCLAGNYQDHIEEGGSTKLSIQDKETPRVFMKPPTTTVVGPQDKILIPPVANSIDWEGELAVVIGRKCKAVKASEALKYVAGYTIMNDVSERALKIKKRTDSRPRDEWFDWLNGKWLDTFAPQGPWIVTRDEIPNPQKLEISTFVNGERKQHNNTSQMLYPVHKIIEYISAIITLEPGDIISTGTISGVGATSGTFMQPGDKVQVEISGIGILKNSVASSKK